MYFTYTKFTVRPRSEAALHAVKKSAFYAVLYNHLNEKELKGRFFAPNKLENHTRKGEKES